MAIFIINGASYNYTVRDISDLSGYSLQYIRKLARNKKIPAIKRGRSWLFNFENIKHRLITHNNFEK